MKDFYKSLFFFLFSSVIILPHGDEEHKKAVKQDTLTIVGKDTIVTNGISRNLFKKDITLELNKEEPVKLNPSEQIFEHMHNKIVHFPIALGVFAFFLSLINFKWKKFDPAILISILIALLFSLAALVTGKNQAPPFIGSSKEWIVEFHQNIGLALIINFFIWIIFMFVDKLKKYAWLAGLIAFILILTAAFLGGVIAH